jgi:hypothetical protein
MRTLTLTIVFVALAGVFCTGKTSKQTSSTAPVKWPKEATAILTESELGQFISALPALNRALKAAKWTPGNTKIGENQIETLTDLVESIKVPGVDDALKPYGGWAKIRLTLYKVYAATAAVLSAD